MVWQVIRGGGQFSGHDDDLHRYGEVTRELAAAKMSRGESIRYSSRLLVFDVESDLDEDLGFRLWTLEALDASARTSLVDLHQCFSDLEVTLERYSCAGRDASSDLSRRNSDYVDLNALPGSQSCGFLRDHRSEYHFWGEDRARKMKEQKKRAQHLLLLYDYERCSNREDDCDPDGDMKAPWNVCGLG